MRQVIRKWFWAWEFDKEEAWLNDMAAKGKALVSARYADRKSTRLNSSHTQKSRMPSSA